MKRETRALTALSVYVLLGCATHPPKIEYEPGPAPYSFDCDAQPGYLQEFNIHAPNGKLRLAGFIEIESVHTPQHPKWRPMVSISLQGPTQEPLVGFWGVINPRLPEQFLLALRNGLKPSDSQLFMALGVGDPPIAFALTMNESRQLTASVGEGKDTIQAAQFDVVRANLSCSGVHVRYSYVTVGPE